MQYFQQVFTIYSIKSFEFWHDCELQCKNQSYPNTLSTSIKTDSREMQEAYEDPANLFRIVTRERTGCLLLLLCKLVEMLVIIMKTFTIQ